MGTALNVGDELPQLVFEVDRSQLRLFAKAIGEQRPEYLESAAARAAGYRDIVAPPTFAFGISINPASQFEIIEAVGADLGSVLHGEQSFDYKQPICAGDLIFVHRRLAEAYEKKNGALKFFVVEGHLDNAAGEILCETRQTIVVRSHDG